VVFPAFIDTNVLFGAYLCDTMLCLAEAGTYRPLWSPMVMEELERNLLERGLPPEAITHRLTEMTSAFPDAQVTAVAWRAQRPRRSLNRLSASGAIDTSGAAAPESCRLTTSPHRR
jgi:PIN domain